MSEDRVEAIQLYKMATKDGKKDVALETSVGVGRGSRRCWQGSEKDGWVRNDGWVDRGKMGSVSLC